MALAGYKTISILFLIVVVALAGVSPVFALRSITFDPPAACPGETVTISNIPVPFDVVGGGISVAAMSPLTIVIVLSSDPVGLIGSQPQDCLFQDDSATCTFQVSESAKCGHYTVSVTFPVDSGASVDDSRPSVSGPFDVAGPCCAVGGCVQPVNTLTLLSPWLAAIGLAGCISTVVAVAKPWKKAEN